ncbi:MAG: carboxypeptidase-like regulatory domain-containing protein [Tannerella sp.]|jgi:hypothetical protein|nr:carboxypeptidase-like regulatory domain-containing protein [Tannerella sp.]
MKKISIVWLLLCSIIGGISAQQIELKGLVREAKNSEPLAFVNVVLQTPDSAFVTGAVSDDNGRFAIPKIQPGDYRLALSFMGYKTLYIEVAGLSKNLALPDILMEEEAVGLDAVTVTGSASTSRIDRKLIFPTERQVKISRNGFDLLQQLMLPRLQMDLMKREISVPGGGEVQLRINGVRVEVNDIAAIQPADIIRVEYHDNPGLRYGNAEVVLDYIVRRHETGGNLGVNIQNAFILKKFGYSGINGRINHKKSEFSVNYNINHQNSFETWRDNEELFTFADGSILRRREAGEPLPGRVLSPNLTAAYSFLNDGRMFNATFRYNVFDYKDNYKARLYDMDRPEDYVRMFDLNKNYVSRPALDLYYQENLKNDQTLIVNLVGTYNHTDDTRSYQESRDGTLLTDANSIVSGNKYSWIGEGIYERKLGANSLSAGVRHTQAYSDNTYRNGHEYHTAMRQGETFLYGEWKGKVRKLDYTLGAGVTRSFFRQENAGEDYEYYTFNPRLALFHPLPGNSSVRLKADIGSNTPSLSSLSDVEQVIDSLQIQRGNPDLKPFLTYRSELNYEWKKGLFYAGFQGRYEYQPSAVMERKFWEGGKIVRTWDNQKNWQRMSGSLQLRVGPVKDILQVSVTGGVNHFISHGNTYRHVYTNPYISIMMNGNYKDFTASLMLYTPQDWFFSEQLFGGSNSHILSLGYKYRAVNFGLSMFNPFYGWKRHIENRSEYASYQQTLHVNDVSRLLLFTFSWNMNFGRSFQSDQKRLNNADEDAGVMKAGK